jgi:quercetin dioxygenase-like cupin family protein
MEIKRSGSRPSRKGPAENFTGSVRIDPLFDPPDPAGAYGELVTFEPRARTAWHTHPLGQTLIVTSGAFSIMDSIGIIGSVSTEGKRPEDAHPAPQLAR